MKCQRENNQQDITSLRAWKFLSLATVAAVLLAAPVAQAAISFETAVDQWWFNPQNWSQGGELLPPGQYIDDEMPELGIIPTDAQVNDGYFLGADGVVFDPDNDPYYDDALLLDYPTGSILVDDTSLPVEQRREFGPQTLYRFYVSRHTTNTNVVTVKSGDLMFAPIDGSGSIVIIGRSGSTPEDANLGKLVQEGGIIRMPYTDLDLGHKEFDEATGTLRQPGNGIYEYKGGTLDVGYANDNQIRVSHGSTDQAGAGGHGRIIIHNPTTGGHVRAFDINFASYPGIDTGTVTPLDPDGVTTGVGFAEFHYANGGTRVVQAERNVIINNGVDPDSAGTRSSRLVLKLDEAPCAGVACVPNDIPLFDTEFNTTDGVVGGIAGEGDIGQFFSNEDNTGNYPDGATVSAYFGGTRYDWEIDYNSEILYANASDADNSIVSSMMMDTAMSEDIVLYGLGSVFVGLPGDYNNNGVVDAADYALWRDNEGSGTPLLNDNGLGTPIGTAHYNLWREHFGEEIGAGSGAGASAVGAPVPEPSALMLALATTLGALLYRRRR